MSNYVELSDIELLARRIENAAKLKYPVRELFLIAEEVRKLERSKPMIGLREAVLEGALIDLVLAIDSGDWDNVDDARREAVQALGFDPLTEEEV